MIFAVGAVMVAVVAAPYALDLRRAAPAAAIGVWLSALVMRALLVLACAVLLIVVAPQTALFAAITHWCWHTVLPIVATHLGLNGHRVGDAAMLLPAAALALSAISVAVGVVRATRLIGALVRRHAIAAGPDNSLIIGGQEVLVAAAGLTRPRVIVSAGALAELDDEELAASLDHERGHIVRGHRWLLLLAELARSLARFIPGTRRVMREVVLHVERDADRWALRRQHDPLALASAICKVAITRAEFKVALASLSGSGAVEDRLDELTDAPAARSRRGARLVRLTAAACVVTTLATAAALPVAATAAVGGASTPAGVERHCAD